MHENRSAHYDILIIGGGAAGFFSAIQAAEKRPGLRIAILEKSEKLLSKVKISGGGRCNVTHHCFDSAQLSTFYPRGGAFLKESFSLFQAQDTVEWYKRSGVRLKTENDGRMFPVTDNSQTIIDCLLNKVRQYRIQIFTSWPVQEITPIQNGFELLGPKGHLTCQKLIVCAGGSPNRNGLLWLEKLGLKMVDPLPSLFTFNVPQHPVRQLAGISLPSATVEIPELKTRQNGPLLITHWGLSGPAVLKLSAWQARELARLNYDFSIRINWTSGNKDQVLERLKDCSEKNPKKQVLGFSPFPEIPQRLWEFLMQPLFETPFRNWAECGRKTWLKMQEVLTAYPLEVKGKTTFKEEFVTCGGVDLSEVSSFTLESHRHSGLYFAGEILDIDGVTGGFNFQAAWTTGALAGQHAAENCG